MLLLVPITKDDDDEDDGTLPTQLPPLYVQSKKGRRRC